MVGGKVIGVARSETSTLLHVEDNNGDALSVRCIERISPNAVGFRGSDFIGREGNAVEIRIGDSVWWQAGYVLWTPAGTEKFVRDVPLTKIGYSH